MSPRFLVGIAGAIALSSSGCWRTNVYAITQADAAPTIVADAKPAVDVLAKSDTVPDAPPDSAPNAPPDAKLIAPDAPPDSAPDAPPDSAPDTPPDSAPDTPPAIVCPTPVLKQGDSNLTLQVGSAKRNYLLHVPRAYDGKKPVPLIVDFHGMPSTGAEEHASSTYPSVTDNEGVVIVYPEGLNGTLGAGWNFGPCCVAGVDDLGFAKALVAQLQKTACIDPARIYAVGTLTGSGMVYLLACQAADIFAAVAPAAFDLVKESVDDCHPSQPITVVSFRGTNDSHVPYKGGLSTLVTNMNITFLGAQATYTKWGQLDRCTATPTTEDTRGCAWATNCQDGVEVVLCTEQNGKEEPGVASIAWPILKRFTR
jgi:polyhydroxybutyrate depolymerase